MSTPTISVIMPTFNSARTIDACLKSIRSQKYPQENIEILVLDGGSTDKTEEISKMYNCTFINGGYKENQEARRGMGLTYAKGEYIAWIDSDNMLPNDEWLTQMMLPFEEDMEIFASQSWRYFPKKTYSAFSRYCALTGVNDPVVPFLKKAEKIDWITNTWKISPFTDQGSYILVETTPSSLPTVGTNGFIIKKDILLKSKCSPEDFFHIDVVYDLVLLGYKKIAYVKCDIYHDTAAKLTNLIKKRIEYFNTHNPQDVNRRYLLVNFKIAKDVLGVILFIISTLSIVYPVLYSIYGYTKKQDNAWFLHTIVCFSFLYAYSVAVFKRFFMRLTIK